MLEKKTNTNNTNQPNNCKFGGFEGFVLENKRTRIALYLTNNYRFEGFEGFVLKKKRTRITLINRITN